MKKWFVLLAKGNQHGPLPPLRMMCSSEEDARKEFRSAECIALGYQMIVEEKAEPWR